MLLTDMEIHAIKDDLEKALKIEEEIKELEDKLYFKSIERYHAAEYLENNIKNLPPIGIVDSRSDESCLTGGERYFITGLEEDHRNKEVIIRSFKSSNEVYLDKKELVQTKEVKFWSYITEFAKMVDYLSKQ